MTKPSPPPPPPPSAIDGRRKLTNVDPVTEADMLRTGRDPDQLDLAAERMLSHIYANLPKMPVYQDRRLPPVLAAADGVDRVSLLPHHIRCQIVCRLPVKDAARTAVLSSRWRKVWLSTPLVLIDAHLLPKGQSFPPTFEHSPAITDAVTSILEAHPGPFSCVHLVCCHMNSYRNKLWCWLQLLATKGVQELVMVNRPWPLDLPFPARLFTITTLTRLYLGNWRLPDISVMVGVSFPDLRELGICNLFMKHGGLECLVDRCPKLEILNILGVIEGLCLSLLSKTLRCVQICVPGVEEITVVKAPRLERLMLYGSCRTARCRVRIRDAPMLHTIGYLEPGQFLQIQEAIIVPGIKASIRSMVSSVKVLALNVRFGVRDDVKMLPSFLRCFPNVEILHIESKKCDKRTGYLNRKFWEKSGPFENVVSHIKEMSITEFRGEPSALIFLEFFFQSAQVLEIADIVLPNPRFTPFSKDVMSKLSKIANFASNKASVLVYLSDGPDGGKPWNFQTGADLSFHDPFSVMNQRPVSCRSPCGSGEGRGNDTDVGGGEKNLAGEQDKKSASEGGEIHFNLKGKEQDSTVVEFKRSQRTNNERENIKDEDMTTLINKVADHRLFTLSLFDKKDKTDNNKGKRKVDQEIKNALRRHAEMMARIIAKAAEVEAVGGTPLSIPHHLLMLPKK